MRYLMNNLKMFGGKGIWFVGSYVEATDQLVLNS
jgi:hypothetical protein